MEGAANNHPHYHIELSLRGIKGERIFLDPRFLIYGNQEEIFQLVERKPCVEEIIYKKLKDESNGIPSIDRRNISIRNNNYPSIVYNIIEYLEKKTYLKLKDNTIRRKDGQRNGECASDEIWIPKEQEKKDIMNAYLCENGHWGEKISVTNIPENSISETTQLSNQDPNIGGGYIPPQQEVVSPDSPDSKYDSQSNNSQTPDILKGTIAKCNRLYIFITPKEIREKYEKNPWLIIEITEPGALILNGEDNYLVIGPTKDHDSVYNYSVYKINSSKNPELLFNLSSPNKIVFFNVNNGNVNNENDKSEVVVPYNSMSIPVDSPLVKNYNNLENHPLCKSK